MRTAAKYSRITSWLNRRPSGVVTTSGGSSSCGWCPPRRVAGEVPADKLGGSSVSELRTARSDNDSVAAAASAPARRRMLCTQ